jgi:type IV pilus assembly protein PilB
MKISDKDKQIFLKFGFSEEMIKRGTFYEPVGCEKCNLGYKGRAAIHEALYFTREIKDIIVSSGNDVDENAIREQAIKDGMWTLRRSGMERMMEGATTLEEVISTTVDD